MARCVELLREDDPGEATTAMGRSLFHRMKWGRVPWALDPPARERFNHHPHAHLAHGTDQHPRPPDFLLVKRASDSRLLSGVLKGLFLELLNCTESLVGRPTMGLHEFLHEVVGTFGDRGLDVRHRTVISSQSRETK